MDNKITIDTLNKLLEINHERIEGYETASKETDNLELKRLFSQFVQTSLRWKHDLTNEIKKLGGKPAEGTKITGKFFRVWMDVKSALASNNRKFILSSCEYGEDQTIRTYKKVLNEDLEHLSFQQQNMIEKQFNLIKSDHYKVKLLHDVLQ